MSRPRLLLQVIPSLLCAGLALFAFYQHRQIQSLQAATVPPPATEPLMLAREVERLNEQLKTTRLTPDTPPPAPPPVVTGNAMIERMRNIKLDPHFQELDASGKRLRLYNAYHPLVERFRLSAQEQEYFYDLVQSRDQAMDYMRLIAPHLPRDEAQQSYREAKAFEAERNEQIRTFLNREEDYEAFRHYEKTRHTRYLIGSFTDALPPDVSITPDALDEVIDTVYAAETQHKRPEMDQEKSFNFSDDELESFAAELRAHDEKIIEAVSSSLSPEQLEVFRRDRLHRTHRDLAEMLHTRGMREFYQP
ncbi:MAG: hypothetical protein Q7P63_11340 [Verrucomicrobiota bacterium JB022]|nr:hypothetical protein [Verrucomicrobiota bacterium JB022]